MSSPPTACCPKCASTSVQAVPIPKKSLGAAVLGQLALGTAAGVAAGSDVVVQIVCLACGTQWIPGTTDEQRMRALSGQLGDPKRAEVQAAIAEERRAAERQAKKDNVGMWLSCGGCLLLVLLGLVATSCSAISVMR